MMHKVTFERDGITCSVEDNAWSYEGCEEAGASVSYRWKGRRGRVTDLIRERIDEGQDSHIEAYLCGGGAMIEYVKRLLLATGLDNQHIHHENFF